MRIDGSHVKVTVKVSIYLGMHSCRNRYKCSLKKICIFKNMKVNKYFKVNMELQVDILKG